MVLVVELQPLPPPRAWRIIVKQSGPHPLGSPKKLMVTQGCRRRQGQLWGCWVVLGENDEDYLGGHEDPLQVIICIFSLNWENVGGWAHLRAFGCWGPFLSASRGLWVGSKSHGGSPDPLETSQEREQGGGKATPEEGVTLFPLLPTAQRAPAHTGALVAWWEKWGRLGPPRALVAPRTPVSARCPLCPCPGDLLR